MSTFDAKGWWRLQGYSYKAAEFHSFQKIVTASENDLMRWIYKGKERILRAVATLKSQGEEEASPVLVQGLLVSVHNYIDPDQVK